MKNAVAGNGFSNRQGVREAYDYRVALPLAVVATLCLIFVAINGHKQISLSSAHGVTRNTVSQPVMPVKQLPRATLSKITPTVDVSAGTTPSTINTTDPQTVNNTGTGDVASSSTSAQTNPQSSSTSTPEDSIPSVGEVNNLISGLNGTTTKVVKSTTSLLRTTTNNLLDAL